ncbi:VanZ family protein [Streptomyces sp. NPDC050255]|uniref:VanZ family protein n=1 Tax=Streptomyces sp. NPDC050255 TaxID=3365606 RepID=UPI00379141FF
MDAEAGRDPRKGTGHRAWSHVLLQVAILVAALLAMVGFSVVLAKVTLTPSPASQDLVTSNLRPGRSLRQYAEDYTFLAACKQAGGNLVLGMPFGVLLPVLVPRRLRMVRMVLLTVLVIVVVELVQGALVAGRAFDIDDVILNTAGALLGYLVLGRRLSHRYHVLAAEPWRETVPAPARRQKPARPGTGKPARKTTGKPAGKPKPTGKRTGKRTGRAATSWTRVRQGVRARLTRKRGRRS